MAFDDVELERIENSVGALCRRRTRPEFRDELEFIYEIDGHNVSIYEVRPAWTDPTQRTKLGIARFKYVRTRNEWQLYWMRRDLKWHRYNVDDARSKRLEPLVRIVEEDRFCAFLG